jgi:hypothetical protein
MTKFTKYKLRVGILFMAGTLCLAPALPAQNRLNDEAIVSQHKRQVFESWETGDLTEKSLGSKPILRTQQCGESLRVETATIRMVKIFAL